MLIGAKPITILLDVIPPAPAKTDRSAVALRWALLSTVVVVAVKLIAAALSHSVSVLAEGLQSIVDIMITLVSMLTLRYAAKPPDEEHPYGHGKAEFLVSALQMLMILASAGFILWAAYRRFLVPEPIHWNWGVAAMAYATVANGIVAAYLVRVYRQTSSALLVSEAMHLRSDILASLGILVGLILVAITGWERVDPAVAAIFTVVAMVMAIQQLRKVIHPLMDGSLPHEEIRALEAVLHSHPQVRGYHNLRTRQTGLLRFVDMHLMLDDELSFVEAHDVAEQIESELRNALGGGIVSVHYEPYEAEMAHRAREHPESLK